VRKLLRFLWNWALPGPWELWDWFVVALPIVVSAATLILGVLDGTSWMYVLVGCSLSFAGIGQGLVAFSNWRYRQTPKEKLNFSQILIAANLGSTSDKISLGFELSSLFDYSMSCTIVRCHSVIEDRIPKTKQILPMFLSIPPRGVAFFRENQIVVDPPRSGNLQGEIEFEVHYGRPHRQKFVLTIRK